MHRWIILSLTGVLAAAYFLQIPPGYSEPWSGIRATAAGDYLSARFAERTGDFHQAGWRYDRLLKGEPENAKLLAQSYHAAIQAGDMEKAMKLARLHSETAPGDPLTRALLALEPLRKKDYQKALDIISAPADAKEGMENDSTASAVLLPLLHVWTLAGQGKAEAALALFESKFGANTDKDLLFLYEAALLNGLAGKQDAAGRYFNQLAVLMPSHRMVGDTVRFYMEAKREDAARDLIRDYLAAHPDADGLAERLERIAAGDTRDMNSRVKDNVLGVLLELAGDASAVAEKEEAILYARMARLLDPSSNDAVALLAGLLDNAGQHKEAIALFGALPEDSFYYAKARIAAAVSHYRGGEKDMAKAMLEKLAKRDPKDTGALLTLGDLLVKEKDFAAAATVYTGAIGRIKDPQTRHWIVFYARGICHERLGQWDKAEPDFQKALALSPDQPDVLNYLGYSWLGMDKNLGEAGDMLKKAIAQKPNDAHVIDSYGWALFKTRRYEEAVRYLERANQLLPHDPTTNDHLGDAYWQAGRKTEGLFQWRRALKYGPDEKHRAAIEHKLEFGLPASGPAEPPPAASAPTADGISLGQ